MEIIIESKTWHSEIKCLFSERNIVDYSELGIRIYGLKTKNTCFLLHLFMDCEGQCDKEGNSFYKFDNFDEMIEFIKKDKDIQINFPKLIEKINTNIS